MSPLCAPIRSINLFQTGWLGDLDCAQPLLCSRFILQTGAADPASLRPSSKTFSSSCQAGEPGLSQLRASNEHLLPALTTSTFTQVDQRVPALAVASSFLHSLLQGWPGCPLLRASSDHSLIVGALRARRAGRLPLVPSEAARCGSTETPWLSCTFSSDRARCASTETDTEQPAPIFPIPR